MNNLLADWRAGMVNVFTVVGECASDPSRLLVLGADGQYYDYRPAQQRFARVAPDREWTVFARQGGGVARGPDARVAERRKPDPATLRR